MKCTTEDIKVLKEEKAALKNMLEMTTNYLAVTKDKLEKRNNQLERATKDIFNSLKFASYLQNRIQPSTSEIEKRFSDCFVINEPRDIIGGDFLWYGTTENQSMIACIDCTGHGVPGALLTMSAYFCLSAVFERKDISSNVEFLKRFNKEFYKYLHHNSSESDNNLNHGLDIGFLRIDHNENVAYFSGTHQRMLHKHHDQMDVYKGGSQYIGDKNLDNLKEQKIKISEGDQFYLFTDGIVDQFGGERQKKLTPKRIIEFIDNVSNTNSQIQYELIEDYIMNWKGTNQQTDDMLLIGLKL